MQETQVQSLGLEVPWRREWQPTPVFLPGEPHGQRSLVGYSPRGHKELDTTEWLTLLLLGRSVQTDTKRAPFAFVSLDSPEFKRDLASLVTSVFTPFLTYFLSLRTSGSLHVSFPLHKILLLLLLTRLSLLLQSSQFPHLQESLLHLMASDNYHHLIILLQYLLQFQSEYSIHFWFSLKITSSMRAGMCCFWNWMVSTVPGKAWGNE